MSLVRLKEVAALAGVSIATASGALNGETRVKPSTRARVQAVAVQLNYRKNSAAAVMGSKKEPHEVRQAFLVWLTALKNVYSFDYLEFAAMEAERMGLQFDHINIHDPRDALRVFRQLEARGCDGIIWGKSGLKGLPPIPWERFSVISSENHPMSEGFDVVRANHFFGTLELLRRVRAAGYRRIGICLCEHTPRIVDDDFRLGAACAFQSSDLMSKERIPILRISFGMAAADAKLVPWVKRYRPDVVVGFNGEQYLYLERHGFSIPEDFAYVALHADIVSNGILAGRQCNTEIVLRQAVRILLEKVRRKNRGLSEHPQETLITPPLLAGASCPCLLGDLPSKIEIPPSKTA
jgi:LacI family transcriptional regulator